MFQATTTLLPSMEDVTACVDGIRPALTGAVMHGCYYAWVLLCMGGTNRSSTRAGHALALMRNA